MISIHRLLGIYQIIGGLCTLFSLWTVMTARGGMAVAALVLLSALALAAGACMWRQGPNRWRLTIANQLVQAVGLYTPWFSVAIMHGAALTLAVHYRAAATFAESTFNLSTTAMLGSSKCDVLIGRAVADLPTYGLSVNFLAVALLIYAGFAIRRSNAIRTAAEKPAVPDTNGAPS